jgi:hypothetical protein
MDLHARWIKAYRVFDKVVEAVGLKDQIAVGLFSSRLRSR